MKKYGDKEYPLQKETYEIIGICMEVHKILGKGFLEIVYKDAIEYEFRKRNIPYEREKKYEIEYKDITLKHHYFADFIVYGKVILEVKSQEGVVDEHRKYVINYLTASKCTIGLIVNFGWDSLEHKRIIR